VSVESFTVRPVDRAADRANVSAIDTSFETRVVFDVVVRARGIELVERELAAPLVKRYSMAEAFAAWSSWDEGWVAHDSSGAACGFAAQRSE